MFGVRKQYSEIDDPWCTTPWHFRIVGSEILQATVVEQENSDSPPQMRTSPEIPALSRGILSQPYTITGGCLSKVHTPVFLLLKSIQ
jgi:hypothetical protein